MKKSEQIYIFTLCFIGMMMAAVASSYRSFFIPTYKTTFGITNTNMGMIISFAQLSSMFFTYFGGKYMLKVGTKNIMALGNIIVGSALLIIANASNWLMLLIAFCFMSSGIALTVLAMNTSLPLITIFGPAIIMNFVHAIFGLGSTIIQKFLGWFITNNYNWRMLFVMTAGLFLINALLSYRAPIKVEDDHKNHQSTMPYKALSYSLMGALTFYVVSEFLMGSWIINYFQEGFNYSPLKAATYSTLFYGTFTFGRIVGGFVMEKVDKIKGIIILLVLAAITVFIGQSLGGFYFYSLGISGIFFAVAYPTTISFITGVYGKNAPYVIGLTSSFIAMGTFVSNILFGYLNDHIGVQNTFYMIPICLLISTIFFTNVYREHKKLEL